MHSATEWARAMRNRTELSAVLIDVDFFKRYNDHYDHYGHQAGDECLRRVAASLRQGLKRPGDLLARYGGEEFVCLLPETPLDGALAIARLLGEQVQALEIAHARSDVASHVSVSLGVCGKPAGIGGSAAELMRQADEQLYTAKTGGRNRSCGAGIRIG